MDVIAHIVHRGVHPKPEAPDDLQVRRAVRAVVYDDQGRIALLKIRGGRQHKIPGGGVEQGEDLHTALRREISEETGADVDILGELGIVIQYDETGTPFHVSYGYVCHVRGPLRKQQLTRKELKQQFELTWPHPEEAIRQLRRERHWKNPQDTSIRDRELAFIVEAQKRLAA